MEHSALLYAHSLYVECLAIGKFAQRRWSGPVIDESLYDFSDSEAEASRVHRVPANIERQSEIESDRTTLPKLRAVSEEVMGAVREWWMSLRSASDLAP